MAGMENKNPGHASKKILQQNKQKGERNTFYFCFIQWLQKNSSLRWNDFIFVSKNIQLLL